MVKSLSTATGRVWINNVDPGVSETFIDDYNFWKNSSSDALFICDDSTMGAQVWIHLATVSDVEELISEIPTQVQSDWTQSSSVAVDFIRNKPPARSQASASRSLNSPFQVSSSRDSLVIYSVDISCSLSLTTGQTGTLFLEIASDSGFTTDVQELCRFVNGNNGTLDTGQDLTQNVTGTLNGFVPAGYYARLRTSNTIGTPIFTYRSGQETLF